MKSFVQKAGISLISLLMPIIALGQESPQDDLGYLGNLVEQIGSFIDLAIPVVTGAALIGFFIGLAKYVFQAGSDEDQEQGKNIMIAGVVALFMIAAIGGIIEVLTASFGVDEGSIGSEGNPVPGLGEDSE
jgi:uncharacterized YccA/Bax inhibitor family protein